MPRKPLADEVVARILDLLRERDDQGKPRHEVLTIAQMLEISTASVSRVAQAHGVARGRGGARPGAGGARPNTGGRRPRAGRPKGSKGGGRPRGPGKQFSSRRDLIIDLISQGLTLEEAGEQVGITKQGADKLLKTARTDETEKK